jgi:hypothetical protein
MAFAGIEETLGLHVDEINILEDTIVVHSNTGTQSVCECNSQVPRKFSHVPKVRTIKVGLGMFPLVPHLANSDFNDMSPEIN